MKFHLRKNLMLLAFAFSASIGAHAATQADIANWTRSASAGNVIDQYNLGLAYGRGEGVAVNFSEAFKWFQMAADNGNSMAMYFVGGYYLAGRGVNRNLLASEEWMLKAAKQGAKPAQQALVLFYRDGAAMPEVPKDAAKAKYWQDVIDGKITLPVDKPPVNCSTDPRTGLPVVSVLFDSIEDRYSKAICALAAFQRSETVPVANCFRDLNQLKGKTNSLQKAEALENQCNEEWIKLYSELFNNYEEKYAECKVSKNPADLEKYPDWKSRLITGRWFARTYANSHEDNGKEGRYLNGRDDFAKRLKDDLNCLPSDADYTLLRRLISFDWSPGSNYAGAISNFASSIKASIKQADKAEADRLAKIRAAEQAKAEANERERYAINWRKSIKEGDYTNKGMVIEVRGNVIKVQQRLCNLFGGNCETDIQYVRRDELYPSND